jgi:RimJ/RimL family protein N-acetyltransferase
MGVLFSCFGLGLVGIRAESRKEGMRATLIAVKDKHFAWLLGERKHLLALRLAPDGIETPDILRMLRKQTSEMQAAGVRGSWLIVVDREVVGLCCYKKLPDADGGVEIAYGIAESRRGHGFASAAVAALVDRGRRNRRIRHLTAETLTNNLASHRVLERNGFQRIGTRIDPDDGVLVVWQRVLRRHRSLLAFPGRMLRCGWHAGFKGQP